MNGSLGYLVAFGRVKVNVTFTRRVWPKWVAAQVLWPRSVRVRSGVPLHNRLLAHELVHVIQWEQFGWRFPFMYLWELRNGYARNKFEIEAYTLENKLEFVQWASEILSNREVK
jgi:hypothetical protein